MEDRLDVEQAVPAIIKSLRLMASPPANHVKSPATGELTISPTALSGLFDGVMPIIPTLIVEEYITPRQAIAIRKVHRALGDLAGEPSFHQIDAALWSRDEWQPLRLAAQAALDEMNALTPNRRRLVCPD
jgi:hypothetical protein